MHIVKETGRLHRLTRLLFNCFVLTEDDGSATYDGSATLIDTGLPGSASAILEKARQLGTPIRRILLTHARTDHVGSLDAIRAARQDVPIFMGANKAPLLAGDCSSYGRPPGPRAFGFMKTRAQPSHLLQDGETVGPLRTVFSPGHTPGHVSVPRCARRHLACRRFLHHPHGRARRRRFQTLLSATEVVLLEPAGGRRKCS